jgi:hypothetical protein
MRQARQVSDMTACLMRDEFATDGQHTGILAEFNPTDLLFTNPKDKRTEAYVTGRIGWGQTHDLTPCDWPSNYHNELLPAGDLQRLGHSFSHGQPFWGYRPGR